MRLIEALTNYDLLGEFITCYRYNHKYIIYKINNFRFFAIHYYYANCFLRKLFSGEPLYQLNRITLKKIMK